VIAALLLFAAAGATCPQVSFEFSGQPDCVALAYDDSRITINNTCEHALLVDQSVQRQTDGGAVDALILPQTTAEVRDLSAFTIGMDGVLYQIVASLASVPESCDDAQGEQSAITDARTEEDTAAR